MGEASSGSIVDINGVSWAGECGVGSAAEGLLEEVVEEMVEEVCFDVCFEEDAPSVWEYRRRVAWPNTLLLVSLRGPSYSTVVFLLVVGKAV